MKKLMCAASIAFACAASIPTAGLVSLLMSPAASAAEQSCQSAAMFATTGGVIRAQLDAIARCNPNNQLARTTLEGTQKVLPPMQSTSLNEPNPNVVEPTKVSICPSTLGSLTTGVAVRGQLDAIAHCN